MDTIPFYPVQMNYGVADGDEMLRAILDGAAGFYSANVATTKTVPCVWQLTTVEYVIFKSFYDDQTQNVKTFFANLITVSDQMTVHHAQFVEDTYKLSEQSGDLYTVSISLIAKQVP